MTTLKIQGNVLASNINVNALVSKTLKLKVLNCNNLSLLQIGNPPFLGVTKTLKISGTLIDTNSTIGRSLYWSSYTSVPLPWNNLNFTTKGINNIGRVVGNDSIGPIYYTAYNGSITNLREFATFSFSFYTAMGISSSSVTVGYVTNNTSSLIIPIQWTSSTVRPTNIATGAYNTTDVRATGISGNKIVGRTDTVPLYWETFVTNPAALQTPYSNYTNQTIGINTNGNIIGTALDSSGNPVPLYWASYTVAPVNINTGSFTKCYVTGINDSGNIVGYVNLNNGNSPLYWSSYTATPIVMRMASYYNFVPSSINNSGIIT
jgi:hypothetical protein